MKKDDQFTYKKDPESFQDLYRSLCKLSAGKLNLPATSGKEAYPSAVFAAFPSFLDAVQ